MVATIFSVLSFFLFVLLSACSAIRSCLVCVERRLFSAAFSAMFFGSSSDCFESGRYLLKAHAGRLAATNSGALILVSDILSLCLCVEFVCDGIPCFVQAK